MTTSSSIGKNCPFCQTPIKPGAPVMICTACGMPHHAECWQENHGCTTFGCQGSPAAAPGTATPPPVFRPTPSGHLACPTCGYLMGPMDTTCPRCEYLRAQVQVAAPPITAMPQMIPPPPAPGYYTQSPQYYAQPGYLPAELPLEMRKWNWGAFFLALFWSAAMNQWAWFILCFIPYLCIIPPFYLGTKGNEIAWKSRRWESLEQFKATQDVWNKWGLILFLIHLGLILLAIIILAITFAEMPSLPGFG